MQRFRHHPLLGTVLEVRVEAPDGVARSVDAAAVREVTRLEGVFSAFDPDSELSRWKRGEVDEPSPELTAVLDVALHWQVRSGGRFNPLAGVLTRAWREAELTGIDPDRRSLTRLAHAIRAPRYEMVAGRPIPTGDVTDLNLHAVAKGWIVDAALERVLADRIDARRIDSVLVNAGGDLAHRGAAAVRIGIEHPLRPFDNEPPIAHVELRNAGLATSGPARQGFRIGARRRSHVLDPRTGWPVETQAAISVVGPDAATADVAATVLGVLRPDRAAAEAPSLGVECLVVAPDGSRSVSPGWPGTGSDAPVPSRT